MRCDICGAILRRTAKLGVCMRNPDCREEHTRRQRAADNLRRRKPQKVCEICGGPLRPSAKLGVCARNPGCKRERERRAYAANPEIKLQADKRYRRSRRARNAAERMQRKAAEQARLRPRIIELRKQGWSKDAIRAELNVGTPFVAEVLQGMPGRLCKICGGPMKAGGVSGICERNPDCKRARIQFSGRFRPRTARGPTNLTTPYLISIWTGRCSRQDCNKILTPAGIGKGMREDWAHLDRIFPDKGYNVGNVRWLCGRCNRQKQDMTSVEMRAMLADQLQAETHARALERPTVAGEPAANHPADDPLGIPDGTPPPSAAAADRVGANRDAA